MNIEPESFTDAQKMSSGSHPTQSRDDTLSANWLDRLSADDRHHLLNELNAIKLGTQTLRQSPEIAGSESATFAVNEIEAAIERLSPILRSSDSDRD